MVKGWEDYGKDVRFPMIPNMILKKEKKMKQRRPESVGLPAYLDSRFCRATDLDQLQANWHFDDWKHHIYNCNPFALGHNWWPHQSPFAKNHAFWPHPPLHHLYPFVRWEIAPLLWSSVKLAFGVVCGPLHWYCSPCRWLGWRHNSPHSFQDLVGTCWGPFGAIWDKDCMLINVHLLQLWQCLDADLRMSQRHIEWKIGLIPGHWPFVFEAIADSRGSSKVFWISKDQELPDMKVHYWWNRDVACPSFPHVFICLPNFLFNDAWNWVVGTLTNIEIEIRFSREPYAGCSITKAQAMTIARSCRPCHGLVLIGRHMPEVSRRIGRLSWVDFPGGNGHLPPSSKLEAGGQFEGSWRHPEIVISTRPFRWLCKRLWRSEVQYVTVCM